MDLPVQLDEIRRKYVGRGMDFTKQLEDAYSTHGKTPGIEWREVEQVCTICESFTVYLAVWKPGKNTQNRVRCDTCKSRISERTIEAMEVIRLSHLRHEDKRGR